MTAWRRSPQIECPIGVFGGYEAQIERMTETINRASGPEEKGRAAGKLLESLSALLDCRAYDQGIPDCRLCRDLTTLRHKTVALVESATALSR